MEYINKTTLYKYQITINFKMDDSFMNWVPAHRLYINSLIEKNVIDYYSVSMETQRSWIIVNAKNKKEVEKIISLTVLQSK